MRDDLPDPRGLRPDSAPARRTDRAAATETLTLRILATTDLHMELLGHDYVADAPLPHRGLAGLARLIAEGRREAAAMGYASLLLDNGDTLQSAALGAELARAPVDPARHALITAFNQLGYDAVGLGNHDLDYGLDYLRDVAAGLKMPVIASNLLLARPGAIRPAALLTCARPDGQRISVGLVSVLPEQTAIWNGHRLGPGDEVTAAAPAVRRRVAMLKAQGAEVILLMAHLGIGGQLENADALARIAGIDALITGHTHRRFPGPDHLQRPGVDPERGMLTGRPAVMPGHAASDLAVLDLYLRREGEEPWRVTRHRARLRPNPSDQPPDQTIERLCMNAHLTTRRSFEVPMAQTARPIQNYFSLAMPTPTCALLAAAQARVVREALEGTPEADLPLVSAAPAHTAGGRGGPDHFLHIPPGRVLKRHLVGLVPYADQLCALRINGAGLRHWLEVSAGVYRQLTPGGGDQPLADSEVPPFNFDTIFGLDYRIDPTRPQGDRIRGLRYAGELVRPEQSFVLATRQFRAAGGGGHRPLEAPDILHRSPVQLEEALLACLSDGEEPLWASARPWRFALPRETRALLDVAPEAMDFIGAVAHLSPERLGKTPRGFVQLRLTLPGGPTACTE
jgi:2',3'-cyclic-nucleotide 2'-phosphodiesterase/3'-nucleotidase